MKYKILITLLLCGVIGAEAQYNDDESRGLKRERVFVGGAISLGVSSGGFSAGANPEVGYSFSEWFDAGISTNLNYYSFSAEYNNGVRQRTFNYGGGVFARVYPIRSIFLQVLPEHNWLTTTAKDVFTNDQRKFTQSATSFLVGAGYTSRQVGQSSFYTLVMFDLSNNPNSPYIGSLGSKFPILRTGFNFYLRPRRQ